MKQNKKTNYVDIIGRWVKIDDNIVHYKPVPKNIKCSKCIDGLDKNCSLCHGVSIKQKPKWYQLKKRLLYWLENY